MWLERQVGRTRQGPYAPLRIPAFVQKAVERYQRLYGRERYNPLCTLQRLAVWRTEGRVASVGASRPVEGPAASRYEQVLAQDVLDSRSALCGAGGRGQPRKTWGGWEVKDNSRLHHPQPGRACSYFHWEWGLQHGERGVRVQGGPGLSLGHVNLEMPFRNHHGDQTKGLVGYCDNVTRNLGAGRVQSIQADSHMGAQGQAATDC